MALQRNLMAWADRLARFTTRKPEDGGRTPAPGPWQEMESWHTWFCAVLIAAAAFAAYFNSLSTPFFFDDIPNIAENPTIRSLWPIWGPLQPPGAGHAVSGRPVVNLSLAINYALGGLEVRGYHWFNLLGHIAAALALFGLVRRTLSLAWAPDGLRGSAQSLGFATALLWTVHPLQTESVTFIIQRTESLAGLIYLTTLYCFVRGSEPGAAAPRRWLLLGVAACWIGVATKEILATAPLIILLYDRTFLAGTFREAWRKRGWVHGLLLLSWGPLALLMAQTGNRGGTVMLGEGVSAWMSLVTQGRAVCGYLQLVFWPHPLVVDYGDYLTDLAPGLAAVWPRFLLVTLLAGATVLALVKRPALGFIGAWFFVILAPSSSFIPLLSQIRAEHRMYLPLAGVLLVVVLLIHRAAGRTAPLVVMLGAAALGTVTVARNYDYESGLVLWADTVRKQPGNPRARYSLGLELTLAGEKTLAMHEYDEALRIAPYDLDTRLALAGLLLDEHRVSEARPHLEAAIQLKPRTSNDNNNLGQLLLRVGDPERAKPYFETALRLDPDNYEAHNNLGYLLAVASRFTEAIGHYRRAVALHPEAAALANLGEALVATGETKEALGCLQQAVRLQPDSAIARLCLGKALIAAGSRSEAVPHLRRVLQLEPGNKMAAELLRSLQPGK